jgi:hypothetical protein
MDLDAGHALRVWGFDHSELRAGAPGDARIAWEVVDPSAASDLRVFGHLVDQGGRQWSTNDDRDAYPRSDWRRGDRVVSWLRLNPLAETPTGGYWLETGFYVKFGRRPLPLYEREAEIGTSLRIGPLKVSGTGPQATGSQLAVFGENEIAVTGVEARGSEVALTWQVLKTPSESYTVFVHVVDASGSPVAQHDGIPVGGSYPTTLWEAGEVIEDVHPLNVLPVGSFTVAVGLYRTTSLERLTARGPDGRLADDQYQVVVSGATRP